MQYRLLGQTGLYVSEICLGTMTFGGDGFWKVIGELGIDAATELVNAAFDGGVNFFDTADVYSEGQSEVILGKALQQLGLPRDEVVIATKVRERVGKGNTPNQIGLSRHHILNGVDRSLKRLQVDYIDLYQVHGFDLLTPIEETLSVLDDVITAGKVRYIGLCNFSAWQIMKALAIADKYQWHRFESVQAYYSLAGRDLEREIIPLAQDQRLSILPWSPLAGGLLSGKFEREKDNPTGARRTTFDFPPVDLERTYKIIDALQPIAQNHNCSIARIALAWLLSRNYVTSVLIGAKSVEQLRDNLMAAELTFTDDELSAIDESSRLPVEYPQWMLDYQAKERSPGGSRSAS
ncbi:aldo/keto reductase [Nostoc sp.]|uniref:aldo/keto reductase n=1 Tax=Nostoc sp. TaxID=1180 RepID=UPI002FF54443